jgi:hypothetical protein
MKAPFNVDSYRANFINGHRAHHFYIQLAWPGFGNILAAGVREGLAGGLNVSSFETLKSSGENALMGAVTAGVDILPSMFTKGSTDSFPYYVKATSLPEMTVEEMTTNWMGAKYKFGGKPTFGDWTVTFNVDSDANIIKKFRDWQNMIINPQTNIASKPSTYMVDQQAHLLGLDGETVCVYKFYSAWPKVIGNVSLDYSTNDITAFDVTFSYLYYMIYDSEESSTMNVLKTGMRSTVNGSINDYFTPKG